MKAEELLKKIEQRLTETSMDAKYENIGEVESVGDGIVKAVGLSKVGFGELVELSDGTKGLAFNLDEDSVSIILLSENMTVKEGDKVKSTGRILSITGSDELIGRVIDPLQTPLDGKKLYLTGKSYPLERIAPGIVEREPVDTPVKTGIKAIDAMIPIGRGQRELIIGDRNTGKTALAIDTIINQKKRDLNLKQLICIYCAIGQKRSNIARTVGKLQEEKAFDYSIIVASGSSDPAALQFLAPFTATAIGEYLMDEKKDVLVIYDDLSKHAWAYRQLSLLLRRPAGREAYPGDIFYLHSRLLERSARLSNKNGGGSLTSLPIIETQAGDNSAYIPTNVISITDGQIYLENDLFNSGIRPAINAGQSVSRVGGAAQSKAMKQVGSPLRLELAQYRSLAAFVQFGSDLDEQTRSKIERGKRVTEVLKQPQYAPLDEVSEIVAIYAATSGALDDVPVEKIQDFEKKFTEFLKVRSKKIVEALKNGEKMDEKIQAELTKILTIFKKTF